MTKPVAGALAMVQYEVSLGADAVDGSPLVVLLHGRGSHRGDLQALRDLLPADAVLVTPQAPHPGPPWGYGPGWAWYRYEAEDRVVEETLDGSLGLIDGFMKELPHNLPVSPGHIFVGGFSQGGTTSMAWGFTRPDRIDGVLNFSGFLVDAPLLERVRTEGPEVPVFWGHGRRDPNIPFVLAEKGRAALRGAGAKLTAVDGDFGHWIEPAEFEHAVRWMQEIVERG